MKKKKITSFAKRIHLTDEEKIVFKGILDDATYNFPQKLARANEILKKAKLLPPVTKK
ncbi:hypothetical protein HB364_12900 [Pseudoflavitalea sp. X16]|uniref:hypothetical protein n=1 Tax=Paraflavitalea devenefica TaxID=2716334 RepID=UPI00141F6A1E|nr:hypothetical protein [Paraflavitalea devenefica]NII25986.1 hypothetical protein [Paraflavitalea devenefica]